MSSLPPKALTPVATHHEAVCGYTAEHAGGDYGGGPAFVWHARTFTVTATHALVAVQPRPTGVRSAVILLNAEDADRLCGLIELADSVRRELAKSRTRKAVDALIARLQREGQPAKKK